MDCHHTTHTESSATHDHVNTVQVFLLLLACKPKKTKTGSVKTDIMLTDNFYTLRGLPFVECGIVDIQIDEWVKNGIIEPCSLLYANQEVIV